MIRLIQSMWWIYFGIGFISRCSADTDNISSQWIRSVSFNRTWCSVDPPAKIIPLTEFESYLATSQSPTENNTECIPAIVKCSWICNQDASCTSINYNATSANCELFNLAILNYESIGTCIHFRSKSSDGICSSLEASAIADVKVIDAQCCSFPFTYNGNLYHECANRLTAEDNVFDIGCFTVNRTWVSCFLPSDFSVTYKVLNINVLNIPGVISVLSINNWIIIQQRLNDSAWFNGSWADYKQGFGKIKENFWIGLEKVYQMTNAAPYRLRIEVETLPNKTWLSIEYDSFVIDAEAKKYTIHVDRYSGDGGDAFNYHNGMAFTTFDYDNDKAKYGNCAAAYGNGGFWYNACFYVCLTCHSSKQAFVWHMHAAKGAVLRFPLDSSRMMMKVV